MKLATKIISGFALFFLVAGFFTIVLLNREMRKVALEDARRQARIIMDENLAIHAYFADKLKPAVFNLLEESDYDPEYFDPAWMSSTYAVREVIKELEYFNGGDYYYKECAVNARSPLNEANRYEAAFIKDINHDPELIETTGIREYQGKPYFVVLRRGEQMDGGCLMCHSVPANAPEELVKIYGPDRSFNRHEGEYVSAISMRIPLEDAYDRVDAVLLKLSLSMLGIFTLLFTAVVYFNRRQLLKPLEELRSHAVRITRNPADVEDEIPLRYSSEFNSLAKSFNTMYGSLKEYQGRLEEKVRERTAELERSNATKDRFIRLLSHDLKNPFHALLSASKTLIENIKGGDHSQSVQLASLINRGAEGAHAKMSGLLEWSQASYREVDFKPERFPLYDVVNNAIETYTVALQNKSLTVVADIAPEREVYADRKMLDTAIENLLSNAIKFTPEGKSIHFSDEQTDHSLLIHIRDEGRGLSKAELTSLFKIESHFSKPGTNKEEGTGFGLLISNEFMRMHGGSITAANSPQGGAVFTIVLPVEK